MLATSSICIRQEITHTLEWLSGSFYRAQTKKIVCLSPIGSILTKICPILSIQKLCFALLFFETPFEEILCLVLLENVPRVLTLSEKPESSFILRWLNIANPILFCRKTLVGQMQTSAVEKFTLENDFPIANAASVPNSTLDAKQPVTNNVLQKVYVAQTIPLFTLTPNRSNVNTMRHWRGKLEEKSKSATTCLQPPIKRWSLITANK